MSYDDLKDKADRSLTTEFELKYLRNEIKDLPVNKKLRELLLNLFGLFSYRWEKQKAEASAKYWRDAEWKRLMAIRTSLEKKKKRKKVKKK